ncbi:MAG: excinuclease ABC subunit C [Flavobacteriaceae bacterium CG_4_8_14_3_um_filter_34_10]|nr:GIY-YIG nuclease family protein [Flavobacteriia bacterium]PIQ17686.1 MAG: excinuclease ABC subunit C [Flavobacteriaceae bacterium CG18_big_fil_WC_8_21_14_2_50_34_36]PIV51423.1 MAG: excinuclease ABC subunit C [Flavobacteriaceae bacterium CG02_land_8_20_14_3_00_34_13]PIX08485.1 MAG: excinuclease ABC subunit C [Flavobacteriaceae bacterium CG_4_8_14_3_um_filter_34_10]PIZ06984.1 MAG: excinuclease ABC subunit C [Flavobacteriaceae bacterium CG_4_10_14_0_8_um_filter_34_31]PJC08557.1 MAG: excinuclea
MYFFTYIIYSKSLDRYYIGSTKDVSQRVEENKFSTQGFTSLAKDWELKYVESLATRSLALKREVQIKRWKSRKIIEKLIG